LSNKIIPKEQLTAYQRWELSSFDERTATPEPVSPPKEQVPAVALPTAEEIEQIHQQAHQDGFATGYQEGRARSTEEAQRLVQLVTAVDEALQQVDKQLSQEMLALALDIAKQMLRQALQVRPELLLPVIQEAMASLPNAGQHPHLILNPEDAAMVRGLMEEELANLHWRIVEDPRITRGGCRIETSSSEIDATLESRWKRVLSALGRDGNWLA
jgi:flagellar assembly protein FliH